MEEIKFTKTTSEDLKKDIKKYIEVSSTKLIIVDDYNGIYLPPTSKGSFYTYLLKLNGSASILNRIPNDKNHIIYNSCSKSNLKPLNKGIFALTKINLNTYIPIIPPLILDIYECVCCKQIFFREFDYQFFNFSSIMGNLIMDNKEESKKIHCHKRCCSDLAFLSYKGSILRNFISPLQFNIDTDILYSPIFSREIFLFDIFNKRNKRNKNVKSIAKTICDTETRIREFLKTGNLSVIEFSIRKSNKLFFLYSEEHNYSFIVPTQTIKLLYNKKKYYSFIKFSQPTLQNNDKSYNTTGITKYYRRMHGILE